jgi:hypothetical protein
VRPNNAFDFLQELDLATTFKFEKNYRPTPVDYQKFHASLTAFKTQFVRAYEFLAIGLKKEAIPRCEDKENGLIKFFLNKIPLGIGRRMYRRLNEQDKKYKDIQEFIASFYRDVNEDFATFQRAKTLSDILCPATEVSSTSEKIVKKLNAMSTDQ